MIAYEDVSSVRSVLGYTFKKHNIAGGGARLLQHCVLYYSTYGIINVCPTQASSCIYVYGPLSAATKRWKRSQLLLPLQ